MKALMMFRRFCFGLVHGFIRVIRRRIECVHFQRLRLRVVNYIVSGSSRNDYGIAAMRQENLLLVKNELGLSLFDPEELVRVAVNLRPDICLRR